MQAEGYEPTLPWLDMMFAFYNDAYAFQKARVIDVLFQAVRCCNAAFLRRSTILDDLIQLGCFDSIGADQLTDACQTRLASDIETCLASWNTTAPAVLRSSKSFLDSTDSARMAKFRSTKKITFNIEETNAYTDFDFHSNWYDIRLFDLSVYLMGAANVHAVEDNPDSMRIVAAIQTGAIFAVQDAKGKAFTFETMERT